MRHRADGLGSRLMHGDRMVVAVGLYIPCTNTRPRQLAFSLSEARNDTRLPVGSFNTPCRAGHPVHVVSQMRYSVIWSWQWGGGTGGTMAPVGRWYGGTGVVVAVVMWW